VGGTGAVPANLLIPPLGRFASLCLVILAGTIITNNSPVIYSVSFSLQLLTRHAQRIPRFVWTLLTTVAYTAIAIPAYGHFAAWLGNFLVIFGYWVAIYQAIALGEH